MDGRLCPDLPKCHPERPHAVFDGEDKSLGAARIEVSSQGTTFVAPNLILHYVTEHNYRPPVEFVRAALVGDWAEPEEISGMPGPTGDRSPIDDWDSDLAKVFYEALATQLGTTIWEARAAVEVSVQPTLMRCLHTRQEMPGVQLKPKFAEKWVPRNFPPTSPTFAGARSAAEVIAERLTQHTPRNTNEA